MMENFNLIDYLSFENILTSNWKKCLLLCSNAFHGTMPLNVQVKFENHFYPSADYIYNTIWYF